MRVFSERTNKQKNSSPAIGITTSFSPISWFCSFHVCVNIQLRIMNRPDVWGDKWEETFWISLLIFCLAMRSYLRPVTPANSHNPKQSNFHFCIPPVHPPLSYLIKKNFVRGWTNLSNFSALLGGISKNTAGETRTRLSWKSTYVRVWVLMPSSVVWHAFSSGQLEPEGCVTMSLATRCHPYYNQQLEQPAKPHPRQLLWLYIISALLHMSF